MPTSLKLCVALTVCGTFLSAGPVAAQVNKYEEAVASSTVPHIVYFAPDSDALTPEAEAALDRVAALYRSMGGATVNIAAHTDRHGNADSNQHLSARMGQRVYAALAERGIPKSFLTVTSLGERQPAVNTEDGKREAKNRRVEVAFGAPMGW